MVTRTIGDQLKDWSALIGNLEGLLKEVPHLAPLRAELAEVMERVRVLEVEQNRATALLRQVNEERNEAVARGQDVKERIADLLRGHFGTKSPELLQFGFRPRTGGPRRRRRAAPPEPPPEPAP
jgi:hypothetical protein